MTPIELCNNMRTLSETRIFLESRSRQCGLGTIRAAWPLVPGLLRGICPSILSLAAFYGTTFLYGGRLGWLENKNAVIFQCMAGCTACNLEYVGTELRLNQFSLSSCPSGYGEATVTISESCGPCGAWTHTGTSPFCSQVFFRLFPHAIATVRGWLETPMKLGCGQTDASTLCTILLS